MRHRRLHFRFVAVIVLHLFLSSLLPADALAQHSRPSLAETDPKDPSIPYEPLVLREQPSQAEKPLVPRELQQRGRAPQASSVFAGLGFRGSRSETAHFDESLGAEFGMGLPWGRGFDLSLGVGKFLEQGSKLTNLRYEGLVRSFLFFDGGGPYLGLGWALEGAHFKSANTPRSGLFATLGLFGGDGLYCEFDFRGSDARLLAAIFEVGFRMRLGLDELPSDKLEKGAKRGPLVNNTRWQTYLNSVEHSDKN